MKSSSGTRVYKMVDITDESLSCVIQALAVKEKEIVISTIDFGGLESKIIQKATEDGLTFPTKVGEQIVEQTLIDYVTTLGNTKLINVYDEEILYEPMP